MLVWISCGSPSGMEMDGAGWHGISLISRINLVEYPLGRADRTSPRLPPTTFGARGVAARKGGG